MSVCAVCHVTGANDELVDYDDCFLCAGCYATVSKRGKILCPTCGSIVSIDRAIQPPKTRQMWCWPCFKDVFLTNLFHDKESV